MENELSWFDRVITPKTNAYKDFIKEMENTPSEIFFQDGERKFTKKEEKYLDIYNYKQEKVNTDQQLNVGSGYNDIHQKSFSERYEEEIDTTSEGFSLYDVITDEDVLKTEDKEIVGKIAFIDSGEIMEYSSSEIYLDALKNALDSNINGFRYETLIKTPELQKKVDDLLYGSFGELNPNSLDSYIEKSKNIEVNTKDILSGEVQDPINNPTKQILEKIKSLHRERNYELLADNFSSAKEIELKIDDLEKQLYNINNQNPKIMETQKEFDKVKFLKDQLKYLGFGEGEQLHKDLEKGINSKEQQFEIKTTSDKTLPGNKADFTLKFNKTESGGIFLNSYHAKLTNEKNEEISHNFPVNRDNSFTAKEAVNLMEGRSVKIEFHNPKSDQQETAFVQFNFEEPKTEKGNYLFQNFYQKYGVDTDKIVEKSNLIFDKPEYKENTIKSLEKGNIVKVKFQENDQIVEGKAILNPENRNLKLYDNDMNRLNTNKPLEGLEQDNKHEKNNVREQSIKR